MITAATVLRPEQRAELMVQELWLPWPPSINRYWRRVGQNILVSEPGRKYREDAVKRIRQLARLRPYDRDDRLMVRILVYVPDNRLRDLDNLAKVPIDCFQAAGIIPDDSQVDALWMVRRGVESPGHIHVQIARFTDRHQDELTQELADAQGDSGV